MHKYFTVLSTIGIIFSGIATLVIPENTSAAPLPVAAYAFDESPATTTVFDLSGNGVNGLLRAGATRTTGKYGTAALLDGINDHILIPNAVSNNISGTQLTISAWLYPQSTSTLDAVVVGKAWNATMTPPYYQYGFELASGTVPVLKIGKTSGVLTATMGSAIPLNQWSNVAITFDGTQVKFYLNGTLVNSAPLSATIVARSRPVRVGTTISNGLFYKGRIDDLRMYNSILTPAEVITDMNTSVSSSTDTQAPSTPANLTATGVSSSQINLSWSTSTDNIGVIGYRVFRGGVQIATSTALSYQNTGLAPSTTYAYAVSAFDAAGNVSSSSTTVIATTLPATTTTIFPVSRSANGRYLVDITGKPFPIMGRTAWFITSQNATDQQLFISDSVARGYSAIELHVVNHDPRGAHPPFDGNNNLPFLNNLGGGVWNGSLTYTNINTQAPDFTTPNEAYWANVDALLALCESQGILVFMFPAYVGFQGGEQGWMQEMTANGTARMQSYGAWIANRYKDQKNIVWMMGGDYSSFNAAELAVENALLTGLHSVPNQQSTQFSAEWESGWIATDEPNFASSMTLNGVYTWSGYVGQEGRRAYSRTPVIPAFLLEEPYDEEGSDGTNANPNATQPVRRFQWAGWLSTIGGYISGNGYIWPFSDVNWRTHLDTQGSRDMGRLNDFMQTLRWWELVPSGLNGMKTLVTVGGGSVNTPDTYVAAAANPNGSALVAYMPPAHSGTITIDMTALSATTQARWFDPTNATYTTISGSPFSNTGTRSFTRPGNNSVGQGDWVLLLQVATTSDTQAPTVPANVTAQGVSPSQINVSWTASSDNVGVVGYTITRDGAVVATTTQTTFGDIGLAQQSAHAYVIKSFDAAGNYSSSSATASATTTAPDTTAPSTPTNLQSASTTANGTRLSWNASTDNVAVLGYTVYRNSVAIASTTALTHIDSGLTASTTYTYSVVAYDASGNRSTSSAPLQVTTLSSASITIGETTVFSAPDSGNGDLLLVQDAVLAQPATIQSISFYVTSAAGNLRLGIYDASGAGGNPGVKKAETNAFTPVVGWNTVAVTAPVSLPAGTYWLAYLPSDSGLSFVKNPSIGTVKLYSYPYGPMPATFSPTHTTETTHWSFYATLTP